MNDNGCTTAVKIVNLTKKFGSFTAVNNISLEVCKGEVFGFLGANGAGKTTTIRMICGLLKSTSGEISVNNISVGDRAEEVKKSIGYMSQKFSLYQDLTPYQNIEFFGKVYGVSKEVITVRQEELARELKMDNLHKMKTAKLPLGYKQRLGLHCALIHDPEIIFLDEPTSGVDPIGRREFWNKIYRLSGAGKTVFVTTHYMDEAEYCHRVAIMNGGNISAMGSPEELKVKYEAATLNDAFINAVLQEQKKVEL